MNQPAFTHVQFPLTALISNIELGQIGLPDIQRPFVWKNAKIRDLFDSMYKGYPVGYLLLWATNAGTSHKSIGANAKQLVPNVVIVDGQQRLTSLYAVIKGHPVIRSNYKTERIRIAFNPVEEKFEVTSAAIEKDKSFIPDISILWSGESDSYEVVDGFLEGLSPVREVSTEEVKRIRRSIFKLSNMLNFPFTALQLSSEVDEEAVAEVFVRINSQGKTLNQADFILTLMSVFWEDGRKELEEFCRKARTPSTGERSPFNYFIQPMPDQLLRVAVGLAFKRARLEHVYSILRGKDLETERFSEERRDAQFETLKAAQSQVLNLQHWHDFLQCLRSAGFRSRRMISSASALIYSYTLYLIGRTEFKVKHDQLRKAIAQWFFMSAVTRRYTGSAESRMESDLAMLRGVTKPEEFVAKLRQVCNVTLTTDFWEVALPNELATSSARSPSLFAYEASLVLLDAPMLFSNFKVVAMLDPAIYGGHKSIERHHLFPKGHLAKLGITQTRDTNQIANYAYLEWALNVEISDKAPNEYLPCIEKRFSQADVQGMYRYHALPHGWESMDYQSFLGARRELIAQIIREAYLHLSGESIVEEKPEAVDIAKLVETGESDLIEFKSTLRVNLHTGKPDKRMEFAILRTLAGFLNKDGGTLVVGVDDYGSPLGIGADNFDSEDKMSLHLDNIVNSRIGPVAAAYMHANFDDFEDGRVLTVRCERARSPVYVKNGNTYHFFIRSGPSTRELSVKDANDYINQRFR